MDRKLWLLLIAHVIAGIAIYAQPRLWPAVAVGRTPPGVPSGASTLISYIVIDSVAQPSLIFSQSCLLGFWTAMSRLPLWKRLAGLGGGIIYLEILTKSAFSPAFQFMPTLAAGTVAVIFYLIPCWNVVIYRITDLPQNTYRKRLRFSIKDLMLFQIVVALVITVATELLNLRVRWFGVLVLFWTSFFIAISLATIWATLGSASPRDRSMTVIVVSILLSLLVCTYTTWCTDWWYPDPYVFIEFTFLHTLALLGSLLVIRSCGYRLVRRDIDTVAIVSS